jgi:LPXTG-motif cell wall-anchored protein
VPTDKDLVKGNLVTRLARRLLAALAIGTLFVVGAFAWSPPAGAQGLDLCDLLGDPYCPPGGGPDVGPGNITCSNGAPIGGTGTCSVGGVDVGDDVTATLTCGDFSAVVFQGTVTEVPSSFSFDVPSDAPSGAGSLSVAGATFPFECGTAAALARTGSNAGPMIAIGGGLVLIGLAAAFGARRRMQTLEPTA